MGERMLDLTEHEESIDMEPAKHYPAVTRRVAVRRIAAAVLTAFGLLAMLLAPDTAGAVSSHSTKGLVISSAKNSKLGTILVSGTTVYTLQSSGTACTAKCLKYWPEVVLAKGVAKAVAGGGVSAAKLGTITRADGVLQVTYAGKPLYWFVKDKAPGEANGNITDAWGKWSAVVTKKASSSGATTTTTSGGTTTTTSPGGGGVGF